MTRERVPIPRSIEHKAPTFREIKRSTASKVSADSGAVNVDN